MTDHLPTSNCLHSYWMTPKGISFSEISDFFLENAQQKFRFLLISTSKFKNNSHQIFVDILRKKNSLISENKIFKFQFEDNTALEIMMVITIIISRAVLSSNWNLKILFSDINEFFFLRMSTKIWWLLFLNFEVDISKNLNFCCAFSRKKSLISENDIPLGVIQ